MKIKINLFKKKNVNNNLFSKIILSLDSNKRKRISKQKNRGEISFSNKKPWKQKGTGRARAGRKSSPLWVKGGRVFPNGNENYKKKIDKKNKNLFLKKIIIFTLKKKKIFILKKKKTLKNIIILTDKINNKKNQKYIFEKDIIKTIKKNEKIFIKKKTIKNILNL
ncbi:50S ribosomal protein L4 [Candidatus Vidania fulgoroideorum]